MQRKPQGKVKLCFTGQFHYLCDKKEYSKAHLYGSTDLNVGCKDIFL